MRPLAFIKGLLKPDHTLRLYVVRELDTGGWRLAWARPGAFNWEWAELDIEAPIFSSRDAAVVHGLVEYQAFAQPVNRWAEDPFPI